MRVNNICRYVILFFCVSGLLLLSSLSPAAVNRVAGLRLTKNTDFLTQLVFDLKKNPQYHAFFLKKPDRLVIDLAHTRFDVAGLQSHRLWANTLIKRVRVGKRKNQTLRVVIDLYSTAHAKLVVLMPDRQHGYRLLLTLTTQKNVEVNSTLSVPLRPHISTQSKPIWLNVVEGEKPPRHYVTAFHRDDGKAILKRVVHGSIHTKHSWAKPLVHGKEAVVKVSTDRVLRSKNVIVLIDPGHGGKDSGTIGPGGICEKDIVLAISRKLYRAINRLPGFSARLTRDGDYYLTLYQRLLAARKNKADLFISIHADAYRETWARGASVFALSEQGATSVSARWLARAENQSEKMGGIDLHNKTYLLQSVLLSLSQNATERSSLQIGNNVLQQLIRHGIALHNGHMEQAKFLVLKSPDIPSLLVETGFLSNYREETHLRNSGYQQRIANAIAGGVQKYFSQHPPRGSWLSMQ